VNLKMETAISENLFGNLVETIVSDKFQAQMSQELPTGTLTFLFTDVVNSTRIWDEFPDGMRSAMVRHDVLIESAVEQNEGLVVRPRGEGDSRFAVFTRPTKAIDAAVAIQRSLMNEPWSIPPLRVRIALHSGEAELRDGDYYGTVVNRCARMRSAAHGGQILMSETTYCLVRDELNKSVYVHALGEFMLKDLKRPENIYQISAEDLPADFPLLMIPDQIRNNLPTTLTSFIGREKALEDLENLLQQSRMVSISGLGGAGKTRLALQIAQNVLNFFPDGVWFVDLASMSTPELVTQYMMSTVGIREEAGSSPEKTLLENLKRKKLLLILDNCEHLLPQITRLVEVLLRNTNRLKILTTTREKLGVTGEIVWRIQSLSIPDTIKDSTYEDLAKFEAVKLFKDRAAAVRPDFMINKENIKAVAQICQRLDGIPLAIELAAARARVLSPEEILTRLDDRFRLLVGNPIALPRQQTLRALIDWSYDLLTPKERILLRRLASFRGGWMLEAAEMICSGGELQKWEVLDLLTSLVDKSFVICETRNGHERFRLLETIVQFSKERLAESNETAEFEQKHAQYYLGVAAYSYGKMWGSDQAACLMRLNEEHENLRAALTHLSQVEGNEALFLQMAGSLWRFWEISGVISEGRAWLETALAKNPNADEYYLANALGGAGHLTRQQGDYTQAKILHEKSLSLFRKLDYKISAARQLNALGEIAQYQGDYVHAIELHKKSLAIRNEISDREGIAVSLRHLGMIARDHGHLQRAKQYLEESLRLERELGDRLLIALSLNDLGLVTYDLCDYDQAALLLEEAMSIQKEFNDRLGISNSLHNLGRVAKDKGDFIRAEILYDECLNLKQELGDKRGICRTTIALSEIAFLKGKYPTAAKLARQSLMLSQEYGIKRLALNSMVLLGFIAIYQGDYETAMPLAEKSLEISTEMDIPLSIGYAKYLSALCKYFEGSLEDARDEFQEALYTFQALNDCRDIASIYVNLARTAYRIGDHEIAIQYLNDGLELSRKLGTRWTHGFVLEIMGLLERSQGNFDRALVLFRESLRLSIEQDNQQGIANCFGALAGMAVLADQPVRATHYFAASARLRRQMEAKMSNHDRKEYEHYLTLVHKQLDHAQFEMEWSEGFSMSAEQIIDDIDNWIVFFDNPK
jgi:predicted ATPase/class 3 adenylate cyclase